MATEQDIENTLRECNETINKIMILLSSIPIENINDSLLSDGNTLLQRSFEAMNLFVSGLSFCQSKEDPPQNFWWDGKLSNFLFKILRYTRDDNSAYDKLRDLVDALDLSIVDRLRNLANCDLMSTRRNGPSKIIIVNYQEIKYDNDKNDPIICPAENCGNSYMNEKSFNFHLRAKHKDDIKNLSFPKALNESTGRICSVREAKLKRQLIKCPMCNTPDLELNRYNDHYKARHDRDFKPLGRKV